MLTVTLSYLYIIVREEQLVQPGNHFRSVSAKITEWLLHRVCCFIALVVAHCASCVGAVSPPAGSRYSFPRLAPDSIPIRVDSVLCNSAAVSSRSPFSYRLRLQRSFQSRSGSFGSGAAPSRICAENLREFQLSITAFRPDVEHDGAAPAMRSCVDVWSVSTFVILFVSARRWEPFHRCSF